MKTILFALLLMSTATFAQQLKPMPLYPNGIPNSKPAPKTYVEQPPNEWGGVSKVVTPTLTPYLPAKAMANGTAVLVIPGGGYSGVAMGHEGDAIAKEFNKIGIAAFVLKYRLPSDEIMVDKTIGPLQDAQTALKMIRDNANSWGINPARVGVIGFSAGGHLASTLGTHFNKVTIDNPNNTSLRPDFMVLLYPVITFGQYAHEGSKNNLIGTKPTQQLVDLYSNEKQITTTTPPTFLVHAEDDDVVPVQNSLMFYDALLKNKVKAEMHIYQAGGHGFGLDNKTTKDKWFDRLANWMDENGWLK